MSDTDPPEPDYSVDLDGVASVDVDALRAVVNAALVWRRATDGQRMAEWDALVAAIDAFEKGADAAQIIDVRLAVQEQGIARLREARRYLQEQADGRAATIEAQGKEIVRLHDELSRLPRRRRFMEEIDAWLNSPRRPDGRAGHRILIGLRGGSPGDYEAVGLIGEGDIVGSAVGRPLDHGSFDPLIEALVEDLKARAAKKGDGHG